MRQRERHKNMQKKLRNIEGQKGTEKEKKVRGEKEKAELNINISTYF